MPKVENIIFTTEWCKILSQSWIYEQDITTSNWMSHQYPKQPSLHHLENMNTSKYPSDFTEAPAYFQELMAGILKDFPFASLLTWMI